MSFPPPYLLQVNKLKYTFGADSDLVVGDVEKTNEEHTIYIRTNNQGKATALLTILAQPRSGLRVVITHLDGSPYTKKLEQLENAEQFLRFAGRALQGNPYFVEVKNTGLIFSKAIIQFPYVGLGGPPFNFFNAIVADAFKDVISQYSGCAIDYATSP